MSQGQFFVTTQNPNDVSGGGGCVCSPEKQIDCRPPYIVVPGNDLENVASPHVVVCQSCAERMVQIMCGEALGSGEVSPVSPSTLWTASELAVLDDDDDVPEV